MILNWRKATYSLSNGNCVEVGTGQALIAVRDSTDPDGPVISVSPGEWTEFTEYLKRVTPRRRARDASAVTATPGPGRHPRPGRPGPARPGAPSTGTL